MTFNETYSVYLHAQIRLVRSTIEEKMMSTKIRREYFQALQYDHKNSSKKTTDKDKDENEDQEEILIMVDNFVLNVRNNFD